MSVSKIKGTLPEGEFRNGLDAIADELADDPHRKRLVIMVIDCGQVQLDFPADVEDGEEIPPGRTVTGRIRRIEAVAPRDTELAREILARAYEHRCGRAPLPFGQQAGLFGVDPETGEKRA